MWNLEWRTRSSRNGIQLDSIYPPLLDKPNAAVAEVAKVSSNSQVAIQNRQVFLIQSTLSSKLKKKNEKQYQQHQKGKNRITTSTFPLVYKKTWKKTFFLLLTLQEKRKFTDFGDDDHIRVSHFFYLFDLTTPFRLTSTCDCELLSAAGT